MIQVKHNGKNFYAMVEDKRITGATEREISDALYELGFDDDDVTYPTVTAAAPIIAPASEAAPEVVEIVVAKVPESAIMIPVAANVAIQTEPSKELQMQTVKFSTKHGNYRTNVEGKLITSFHMDKMIQRMADVGISEESIEWDESERAADYVAPLVKPRAIRSDVRAKAITETTEASVSIAKSEFSVKERFEFIEEFTRLCARGVIPSLILTGSGGIGKTKNIMKTLASLHLTEDAIGEVDGDFIFVKGYSTARNLYTTLFNNNGKIIIFDDCDTAFKDPISSNILKGALDSNGKRIITWGAESRDESIPSRFEFFGKVIFISNISLSKFPQALLSRSMLVDLTLNQEEMVERIEQTFAEDVEYEAEDKVGALEFIKRNASKFKDLNVRSAFNALKMKVAIGDNWEKMALYSATVN